MDNSIISTSNLTKFYGNKRGIISVNLNVLKGEVFGFLGPNGAGKTTTIRLLMDFIRPSGGKALIFGMDSKNDSVAIKKRIGYLPGELHLYENLTGRSFLRFMADLKGGVEWDFVNGMADKLKAELNVKIKSLSHGNKQKISIIAAFMHKPDLVILDEPTSGLDPLIQLEFHVIISEFKKMGKTVFISSHNLGEVEKICDRIGVIKEGKLIAIEKVGTLKDQAIRRVEVYFAGPVDQRDFARIEGVTAIEIKDKVLNCVVVGSLDQLVKVAAKYQVVDIVSHEPNLEEIFMNYYQGNDN